MNRKFDLAEVEAALKRAAIKAISGTAEERSGRYQHVEPTTISLIRYNRETGELELTFLSSRTFRYANVPAEIHLDLLEAGSKDQFFHDNIEGKFTSVDVRRAGRG